MQPLLGRFLQIAVGVIINGLHIPVFFRAVRPPVDHADLLALVEEGRALLEQVHSRQRFGAFLLIFLTAVAGDHAGVIVIFNVEHVPGPAVELVLPVGEGPFHTAQREFGGQIVRKQTVGALALELDHHIQLAGFLIDVLQRLPGPDQGCFRQGKAIVMVKNIPLEFSQVFVDMGAVVVVGHALIDGEEMVVR